MERVGFEFRRLLHAKAGPSTTWHYNTRSALWGLFTRVRRRRRRSCGQPDKSASVYFAGASITSRTFRARPSGVNGF